MPKFSVVVPTYNRAQLIATSIKSLLEQTFRDFEIIVIDDGSKDATKEALKPLMDKIRYCHQQNGGISAARNHGILEAKGEFIAFTDDDIITDKDWLANINRCFTENHCDVVGGRVLPIYTNDTPSWVRKEPTKMSGGVVIYDYGEETVIHDPSHHSFIGCNFAFRREIFKECGDFRVDIRFKGRIALGEDTELIERTMKQNKVLYYCGKAVVHHPVDMRRLTLGHFMRWNLALGRYSARQEQENSKKHFAYWFGVPRYLWKGVILDFGALCVSVFDRLSLQLAWRNFFRKVGMIFEYQVMHREGKT